MVKLNEEVEVDELLEEEVLEDEVLEDEVLEDEVLEEDVEEEEEEDLGIEDDPKGGEENEEVDLDKEDALDKTFSQEELKGILKSRLARERKSFDKEVSKLVDERFKEKERKSKLTEEEVLLEELSDKEKTLKQREQELDFRERFSATESELRSRGLHTPFTKYVVTEDPEETEANINEFQDLYNRSVREGVKEALKGKTPSGNRRNRNKGITVSDFRKLSYGERVELKRKDNKLFDKLSELSKK